MVIKMDEYDVPPEYSGNIEKRKRIKNPNVKTIVLTLDKKYIEMLKELADDHLGVAVTQLIKVIIAQYLIKNGKE